MLALGSVDVATLLSHHFAFDQAAKAYDLIAQGTAGLGIVLDYSDQQQQDDQELRRATIVHKTDNPAAAAVPVVGLIGAGNYAQRFLVPALRQAQAKLKTVASTTGINGRRLAHKFGFGENTSDNQVIFADREINTVMIATHHDSHARLLCQALAAGKHVWVEKPMALSLTELNAIKASYDQAFAAGARPIVMVGFNRRFAPHVQKIKSLLGGINEPKAVVITVNAGAVPAGHWSVDPQFGGGRIVGEGCHFVDLLRFIVAAPIDDVQTTVMGTGTGRYHDRTTFTLHFTDGSLGTVHYFANGPSFFAKRTPRSVLWRSGTSS